MGPADGVFVVRWLRDSGVPEALSARAPAQVRGLQLVCTLRSRGQGARGRGVLGSGAGAPAERGARGSRTRVFGPDLRFFRGRIVLCVVILMQTIR